MDIIKYIAALYKTAGQLNLYIKLCYDDSSEVYERVRRDLERIKLLIHAIEQEIPEIKP